MSHSYIDGSSLLEAFCKTIYGNEFSDVEAETSFLRYSKEIEETMGSISHLWASATEGSISLSPRCALGVDQLGFLQGRSFFTTIEGCLGLGLAGIQPGDQVVTLLGRFSSLIVRPVANGPYQVAGESYVQGLMNYEAFLADCHPA
jgi:hypothetical protein